MPELRLVVLALQDRLVYAPTFEAALSGAVRRGRGGARGRRATPSARQHGAARRGGTSRPRPATTMQALIARAAQNLADYQRLTAEGKLGEAGQKLEELKRTLDELSQAAVGQALSSARGRRAPGAVPS